MSIVAIRGIRRHIDTLRAALSDKENAELDRLIQRHDQANALAVHAENAVKAIADAVIDGLPTEVGEAEIVEAAARVPHADSLKLVAERVARAAERDARKLIEAKRPELIKVLNAEFDAIRKEAAKLLPVVLPLESASDAIRSGAATEWARVEDLHAEHQALRREIDGLRRDGILPTFKTEGGYGSWRHPQTATRYSDLPPFRRFSEDLRRHAYVPASQAEVGEVRAADQASQQESANVG